MNHGEALCQELFCTSGLSNLNVDFEKSSLDSCIEVKSCKESVHDFSHLNTWRAGRFKLNGLQHTYLLENNGYYFFTVTHEWGISWKLIKAKNIVYHNMEIEYRNFTWRVIWRYKAEKEGNIFVVRNKI